MPRQARASEADNHNLTWNGWPTEIMHGWMAGQWEWSVGRAGVECELWGISPGQHVCTCNTLNVKTKVIPESIS